MTTEKALDDWLAGQKKRVDAGTFEENSYLAKYHAALHLKKLSQVQENILHLSDINRYV